MIIAKHLETLNDYLQRVILPALGAAHEAYLLRAVSAQWDRFAILNNWMHKLLIFVERSYVTRQPHKMGLKERGVRQFSQVVFSRSGRLGPLVAAIDTIIARRRAGEEVVEIQDQEACRTCVQLLVETGVTAELKEQLLASAREYFAGRAAEWIQDGGGVARYMARVETALLQEEALIKEFDLGKATGEQTLVVGIQELVQAHGESLLTREVGGCAWLLQQQKHDDLGLMYRLFRRETSVTAAAALVAVKPEPFALPASLSAGSSSSSSQGALPLPPAPLPPGSSNVDLASLSALSLSHATSAGSSSASLSPPSSSSEHPLLDRMGALLEEHIVSLGDEIQRDRNARVSKDRKLEAYDPTYINALLGVHSNYVELTTTTLGAHSVFKSRLHAAFVAILNHRGRGPEEKPRLITTACDRLLRVGGTSEESQVQEILGLVVYLKDKDYFESCYRTEMMRRLLSNRYGDGAEKSALAKLRLEHGVHFAQHSQRMLNETATSKELVQAFARTEEGGRLRQVHRVDFNVTVMAQGGWPLPASYAQFGCRPPSVLVSYLEAFTGFYLGLDIGRGKKLEWVLREGLLVVQATFGATKYELSSNPQMLFPLLAFSMDDSVELTLGALVDRTGMTLPNLEIVLAELQKAGLLTVQKKPQQAQQQFNSTGSAGSTGSLVPRDESSESTSSSSSSSSAVHAGLVALNTHFSSKHKRLTILPKKMDEDKEKAMSEVSIGNLTHPQLSSRTHPPTHI